MRRILRVLLAIAPLLSLSVRSFAAEPALPEEGQLLNDAAGESRLIGAMIQTEVEVAIKAAARAGDAAQARSQFKQMLETTLASPDLQAAARAQIRARLEQAIRLAERRADESEARGVQAASRQTAAEEQRRLLNGLEREQEKTRQLIDRISGLLDERRYAEAEEAATIAEQAAPHAPVAVSATVGSRTQRYTREALVTRIERQKGVVDTLRSAELAHVPMSDDPPYRMPDAQVWEELTLRRGPYRASDLTRQGPAERKIRKQLDELTSIDFAETPLQDVIDYLKDLHGIEIQLDAKALDAAGIGADTPITRNLKGITLRSTLRLMLGALDLTYVVKDEVLWITTPDEAANILLPRVYPVADLVVPIRTPSFTGGFGPLGGMSGNGSNPLGGQTGQNQNPFMNPPGGNNNRGLPPF